MCTVWLSGCMLDCRTPVLKGSVIDLSFSDCGPSGRLCEICSRRIGPRMFEPFNQLPHRSIEWGRHAGLFSPFTIAPIIKTYFVWRLASQSCKNLAFLLAGALA